MVSVLSRLLSCEIALSGRYWLYYESLDQLKVSLNVFNCIRVSFRLNCLKAVRPRVRTITDLTSISLTMLKFDELVKELTVLVEECN